MVSYSLDAEGKTEDENWGAYVWRVDDYELLETYGMEMAEGRYFSQQYSLDQEQAVVINEALAHSLGGMNP